MTNAPQTINDLEFNKFLEVAGKVGIRVLLTHGDGWKVPVSTVASLPHTGNEIGDVRIALDTRIPYVWNGSEWTIWSWASSSWGGISGTLADQADLQSALNGKMSAGAYVFTSRDSLIANQVNLGLLTTGMLKITVSGGIATPSIVSPTNWDAAYTHTTNTSNPHSVTKAQVGLGNVDNTSDANKPVSTAQAAADTTVLNTAKSYADSLVVGLVDDRGNYDASTNLFPSTGGSGTAGAVLKGDLWTVSVAGTLIGKAVTAGDLVRALVDTPGQTSSNWAVTENNIGYVAENQSNKVTAIAGNETSNVVYPTVKALYDWANPIISARELLSNKATVLSTSNDTLYPTVKAVVDALTLKANDSAVVHIAGTETITGNKTITGKLDIQGNYLEISKVIPSFGGIDLGWYQEIDGSNGTWLLSKSVNGVYNANALAINEGLNVGIGTTAPTEKLHITGNIYQTASTNTLHYIDRISSGDGARVMFRTAGADKWGVGQHPFFGTDFCIMSEVTSNAILRLTEGNDLLVNSQNWTSEWTQYTVNAIGDSGSIGSVLYSNVGRYKVVGKTCFLQLNANWATKGTITGQVRFNLPSGITPKNGWEAAQAVVFGTNGTHFSNMNCYVQADPAGTIVVMGGMYSGYNWSSAPATNITLRGTMVFEIL